MNEEEKVPNISKTRINDNSAINYTNSQFDGNSLELDGADQERMDFSELTKNFENGGDLQSRNPAGSGIDARRAAELQALGYNADPFASNTKGTYESDQKLITDPDYQDENFSNQPQHELK